LLGWLDRIAEGIESLTTGIVSGIIDGIKAIFVPSEDFLTEKVEAIQSKFGIADSVITIGTDIKGVFESISGGTVPYIEVDFSGLDTKYNYGGKVVVLDMSWYAPFKPYVDSILSAMIWLFFAWRLFINAPTIISGMSSGVPESTTTISQIPDIPRVAPSHRLETKGFTMGSRR
jgi:hypothetical protein